MRKIFRHYLPDPRTIFLFVLVLAVFCYPSFSFLNHIGIRLLSYSDAQSMAVSVFAAKSVDELINSKLLRLQTLAYIRSGTKHLNEKLMKEKLKEIGPAAAKLGYNQIRLTDPNGLSVGLNKAVIDIAGSDHFYRAIRGFSFISYSKGRIVFSVPMFSGADVIGVLTAETGASEAGLLKDTKMPCGNADVFIIDDNLNTVDYNGTPCGKDHPDTAESGFLTMLGEILDPHDLERIRETIPTISGERVVRFKSDKEGRVLSIAGLPRSDGWRFVTISSKDSAEARQKSLLLLGSTLMLALSGLLSLITMSLYLMYKKYSRIRDLARRTIDQAGFYFFKLSGSGEVREFSRDLALLLGMHDRTRTFSLSEFTDEGDKTFPADLSKQKELHLSFTLPHGDKKRIHTIIHVIGKNESGFYPVFAIDVTKDHELREKIDRLAYVDATTGIPNKESFILKIESLNERCVYESFRSVMLFVDVNNSHKILEIFGHRLFENMLKETAGRLSAAAEDIGASLYTLGADDFVLVIDNCEDNAVMLTAANKILKRFEPSFDLGDASYNVSCRIGMVSCVEYLQKTPITTGDIFRYGEITVRLAKKSPDLVFTLDRETYLSVVNELDKEIDLTNSIENDELSLCYQPIFSYYRNSIIAVEALLRWENKKHGSVPPSAFIPLAEKCGFINKLGDFVIDSSLALADRFRSENKELFVSFNVSSMQFLQVDFIEKLTEKIKRLGLSGNSIGIEITETFFYEDTGDLRKKLETIRKEGIRLMIDDFGTGYSSLSYIKDLPFDYLKIDRCFTGDLETSRRHVRMFRGITNIARSLGINVIAEGIETKGQLDAALSNGCGIIQGFLIAKPMPEDELFRFMESFRGFKGE